MFVQINFITWTETDKKFVSKLDKIQWLANWFAQEKFTARQLMWPPVNQFSRMWSSSPGMAGGNVTVSHISWCAVNFVVQTKLQGTVRVWFRSWWCARPPWLGSTSPRSGVCRSGHAGKTYISENWGGGRLRVHGSCAPLVSLLFCQYMLSIFRGPGIDEISPTSTLFSIHHKIWMRTYPPKKSYNPSSSQRLFRWRPRRAFEVSELGSIIHSYR